MRNEFLSPGARKAKRAYHQAYYKANREKILAQQMEYWELKGRELAGIAG